VKPALASPCLLRAIPMSMLTFIWWHVYPPPVDFGFEASAKACPGGYLSADDDILYSILDMDFREFHFHALR
jgi:hypothetical protein